MKPHPRRDMENWIRRQLFAESEDGPCHHFTLKHVGAGSKRGSEVISINVSDQPGDDFVTELINEIEATAASDAGGIGGVQSYIVQSFYAKAKSRPAARFSFRVQGDDPEGDFSSEGESSEPATAAGLAKQAMRHLEAVMRTSTMSTGHVMAMMQRTINRLADQNEALSEDKLNTLSVVESLHSQKHERDLETRKADHRQGLAEKAFDKLALLAPVAVNKLTGQKLLPEKKSSGEVVIGEFVQSLTPEQLTKMESILDTEQLIAFAQAAQSFLPPGDPEN